MCKEIKMISAEFPFSLLYMTNPRGPARNTIIKLNKIKSGVRTMGRGVMHRSFIVSR